MDIKSEVELKFAADSVMKQKFMEVIHQLYDAKAPTFAYKTVSGTDKYYRNAAGTKLRHRCDGSRKTSVLTWKDRKSDASIADRHEIDLPIDPSVQGGELVDAFLTATGWNLHFSIFKISYIFHVEDVTGARFCIALYDVYKDEYDEYDKPRRFLEIEVEKDNSFSPEIAMVKLHEQAMWLIGAFGLGEPLNQSLAEIYAPK